MARDNDDGGTVVPFRGGKGTGPKRPRKTAGDKQQANQTRPPSHQLSTRLCGARLRDGDRQSQRADDDTCAHGAGWGTDHAGWGRCKRHGGSSANGRKHAALLFAQAQRDEHKARAQFYGGRVEITPEEALLEALQLAAGAVRFIGEYIASWNQTAADAAELENVDPWPEGDAAKPEWSAARQAVEGFRLGWDHASDGLTTGRLSDPRTMLPTLVAAYSTERALGFTDTEHAAWLKVYREERILLVKCAQACIAANIQDRIARVMEERAALHRAILEHAVRELGVTADPAVVRTVLQSATRKAIAELSGRTVTA